MKNSICLFVLTVLSLGTPVMFAQKITLVSGDLKALQGESVLKVQYQYDSNLRVGKLSEQEYTAKKVADYNQKVPGKGDRWLQNWKSDRTSSYHPKFEELMNKYLSPANLRIAPDATSAKYTLILNTTFIEPGWNIAISRHNAYIDVDVHIVESSNPSRSVAKLTIHRSPGADAWGDDYDVAQRISESYAKCGKELAKYMVKKGLK